MTYDVTIKLTVDAESPAHAVALGEIVAKQAEEVWAEVHATKVYRNATEWGES